MTVLDSEISGRLFALCSEKEISLEGIDVVACEQKLRNIIDRNFKLRRRTVLLHQFLTRDAVKTAAAFNLKLETVQRYNREALRVILVALADQ